VHRCLSFVCPASPPANLDDVIGLRMTSSARRTALAGDAEIAEPFYADAHERADPVESRPTCRSVNYTMGEPVTPPHLVLGEAFLAQWSSLPPVRSAGFSAVRHARCGCPKLAPPSLGSGELIGPRRTFGVGHPMVSSDFPLTDREAWATCRVGCR